LLRVKLAPENVDFHLAQINIGRAVGPIDGPELVEFHALLDPVNALADSSPGFVWRLQTDAGNATALRPYDDDRIIVNMSLWESLEALRAFVYTTMHTQVMRRRREWFERFPTSYLALWWVQAGALPTVEDAKLRLASLDAHGPTPYAFTFRQTFAPDPVPA
jgi:heme-degrading monooxygenase HmoA